MLKYNLINKFLIPTKIDTKINVCHERALWVDVIILAMYDCLYIPEILKHTRKRVYNPRLTHKRNAIKWLNVTNEDFITVCNLANLEPNWVLSQFNQYKDDSKCFVIRRMGKHNLKKDKDN